MPSVSDQPLVKLGLLGGSGRMGRMVARLLANEYADRALLKAAPGRHDATAPLQDCDAVIDFSLPAATLAFLENAEPGALPPLACGVTGWNADQRDQLNALAKKHTVLLAPNFSIGILILRNLLEQASPVLRQLGYTPVLTEIHHRHKIDAPSGTALALNKAINADNPEDVQTHAIRAGEVIGEHQVNFYGASDSLVLGHAAQDRSLFARGAIDVALWLAAKQPGAGLLDMNDYFHGLTGLEKTT